MSASNPRIRGLVLVICNSFEDTPHAIKQACESDAATMKQLWGDMLKCHSFPIRRDANNTDFIVHQDVSAQGMLELLTDFSECNYSADYSYIAVVISTHGGLVANSWAEKWDPISNNANLSSYRSDGNDDFVKYTHDLTDGKYVNEKMVEVFFGNDFKPIREEKVRKLFHNNAARGWQDVPKFFILNYCRGNAVDNGAIRIPKRSILGTAFGPSEEDISVNPNADDGIASLMPEVSDVLIVYATHRSYLTFSGGREFGSWLVTTIGKVFSKYAKNMHVVDMLTIVNEEMKKKEIEIRGNRVKTMSIYESSLEKNLYLCDAAKECGDVIREWMQEMRLGADSGIREIRTSLYERRFEIPVGEAPQRDLSRWNGGIRQSGEHTAREQRMQEPDEQLMRVSRRGEDLFLSGEAIARDQRMHGSHMNDEPPIGMDGRRYDAVPERRHVNLPYWEGPRVNEGRVQHYGEILLIIGAVAISQMILPRFHG